MVGCAVVASGSDQYGMDSLSGGHTFRLAMAIDGHEVPRPVGALFGCTVHRMGVTSVIELRGELDLAAREMLDAALEMALEPGLVMTVVADLDRVTNADAFTVAWLLRADAQVRLTGARFVAVTGRGRAGKVLRLTGAGQRLDVVGAPYAP
jgi:anti-anti-sigma factor